MIHKFLTFFTTLDYRTDDVSAFSGGFILSLLTWAHINPTEVIGKLVMTFAVGLIGGIGGITARVLCKNITTLFIKWKQKNSQQ